MKDSMFQRWSGWQPRDGRGEPAFSAWVNGWTRTWGIFLLIGSLLPYGRPRMLIWFWQFGATGHGSELLVTLPAVALGLLAVFVVARGHRPWLLGPLALGLVAHAGFMAIRAQERMESFVAVPVTLIQILLVMGCAVALVAAGNHLRKRTGAGTRSRLLTGVGGAVIVGVFLVPVEKPEILIMTLLRAVVEAPPYYLAPFLLLVAYGILGLLAATNRRESVGARLSFLLRLTVTAIPLVPVVGALLHRGIGIREAHNVLYWTKSCLSVFGMLGLLAVGLVVWFRPPEDGLNEDEGPGPDPSGDAPLRPGP